MDLIGLIPAAGTASRLAPLPCSKEILPVRANAPASGERPQPVMVGLLDRMRLAGVRRAFIVIREGKWDIPAYLEDGRRVGVSLGYLMVTESYGPPFTLDQAYPFVRDATVVFGFPDIMVAPADVYTLLLERLEARRPDIVLALFSAHAPREMDMVQTDEQDVVRGMWLKPHRTDLRDCWIAAVWRSTFTEYLHEQLRALRSCATSPAGTFPELTIGHLLQAALTGGLRVEAVRIPDGRYLDIGTPDAWHRALIDGLPARSEEPHTTEGCR